MDVAAIPSVALCNDILVAEFYQRFVGGWDFVVTLFCRVCGVELKGAI